MHSAVLDRYVNHEMRLKEQLHELVVNRAPLGMLYVSIQKDGLINPLIVHAGHGDELGGLYFVVVGNQRLAVLRAIEHHQHRLWAKSERPVSCIIAKPEDDWTDSTRARKEGPIENMGFNPYKKCWVKNPPTDGWNRERDA